LGKGGGGGAAFFGFEEGKVVDSDFKGKGDGLSSLAMGYWIETTVFNLLLTR
jgi:hypothetical protein